jgi:hypothetical protein
MHSVTAPRVAYIFGPYRAATEYGVLQNVRASENLAAQLWSMRCPAISPHMNTGFFGGLASDQTWLDGTLELLRRCDYLVGLPGWSKSTGSIGEVREALRLGKPVFKPDVPTAVIRDYAFQGRIPPSYYLIKEEDLPRAD